MAKRSQSYALIMQHSIKSERRSAMLKSWQTTNYQISFGQDLFGYSKCVNSSNIFSHIYY